MPASFFSNARAAAKYFGRASEIAAYTAPTPIFAVPQNAPLPRVQRRRIVMIVRHDYGAAVLTTQRKPVFGRSTGALCSGK